MMVCESKFSPLALRKSIVHVEVNCCTVLIVRGLWPDRSSSVQRRPWPLPRSLGKYSSASNLVAAESRSLSWYDISLAILPILEFGPSLAARRSTSADAGMTVESKGTLSLLAGPEQRNLSATCRFANFRIESYSPLISNLPGGALSNASVISRPCAFHHHHHITTVFNTFFTASSFRSSAPYSTITSSSSSCDALT